MVVIVSGLPGSGKSFFAEKLAKILDAEYLNSDKVRHELHAAGKYSFRDKLIVYKQMAADTARLLGENKSVVVDATFYHHTMRELFLQIAKCYHCPIHVIEVTADENKIRQRLMHPRKYSEADFGVYEKVRDEFDPIAMPHLVLDSTNDDIGSMLTTALDYIDHERE
jgi:predicted kinase